MTCCGAPHPEDADRNCIIPTSATHGDHQDPHGVWPNLETLAHVASTPHTRGGRRSAKQRLIQTQDRIRRSRISTMMTNGIPIEAMQAWSKDDWQRYAEQIFVGFLKQRTEPFTTPEDVWPLLVNPTTSSRRSLVRVVDKMVKAGYMAEVGPTPVRLGGGFHTLDGVEFEENKYCTVYISKIAETVACKYGDTTCPCQDGDQCHYEGENPMTPPGQPLRA